MKPRAIALVILCGFYGCYLPMPEHGLVSGRAMITEQQLRDIPLGTHTREDILMSFGDPSSIRADGTIFIYHWERVTGMVAVGFGYGVGGADDVSQNQYFVVQFDEDSTVRRVELIDPLVIQSPDKLLAELLESWQAGSEK